MRERVECSCAKPSPPTSRVGTAAGRSPAAFYLDGITTNRIVLKAVPAVVFTLQYPVRAWVGTFATTFDPDAALKLAFTPARLTDSAEPMCRPTSTTVASTLPLRGATAVMAGRTTTRVDANRVKSAFAVPAEVVTVIVFDPGVTV